jgi:hypothetical protein
MVYNLRITEFVDFVRRPELEYVGKNVWKAGRVSVSRRRKHDILLGPVFEVIIFPMEPTKQTPPFT